MNAATTDRDAAAGLILNLAVHDAIDLFRAGQPDVARWRLREAAESAQRVLGGAR